ncbi:MAG: hypothetical protein QM764_07055 [Chitinophagaceae bacterium]
MQEIIDEQYSLVWFSGDIECAKQWYLHRENGQKVEQFDVQVDNILKNGIPDNLKRKVIKIDVFKKGCEFKSDNEIFYEILREL